MRDTILHNKKIAKIEEYHGEYHMEDMRLPYGTPSGIPYVITIGNFWMF